VVAGRMWPLVSDSTLLMNYLALWQRAMTVAKWTIFCGN